jgi:hypothetical protein
MLLVEIPKTKSSQSIIAQKKKILSVNFTIIICIIASESCIFAIKVASSRFCMHDRTTWAA